MIKHRNSEERGRVDHGWLLARHSFSFASYFDSEHMGFRSLRVLNEDRIAGGSGFPMHSHQDMEILTYVIDGRLEHRDSMGNGSTIHGGEFQRMTAGRGVRHSEKNASSEDTLHLLQIWLEPDSKDLEPSYEQRRFENRRNRLQLVASKDGRENSITIHQDAALYSALLDSEIAVEHALSPDRHAWLQVVSGRVAVGAEEFGAGDAARISGEANVPIRALEISEVLLFDLA